MKLKKILIAVSFLMTFASCKNTEYLSTKYGEIISGDIIRIEYYEGKNYLSLDDDKKPNKTISDRTKITEIVTEINYSNNPGPWKGAHWDKVVIVKKDTTLTYSTNGKVIGQNQNSGFFYELKDEQFIERFFEN